MSLNSNINCVQFGVLNGGGYAKMFESDRRVYSSESISPTITTVPGGNKELKISEEKDVSGAVRTGGHGSTDRHSWDLVCEPVICASRGRNPENPSDRTVGAETQQRIEINENGTSNTITTVQKDNLVLENMIDSYNSNAKHQQDLLQSADGVCRCLCVGTHASGPHLTKTVVEVEPQLVGGIGDINFGTQWRQGNRVYDSNNVGMCLTASGVGNAGGESYLYSVETEQGVSIRRRTENGDYGIQGKRVAKENQIGDTITTSHSGNVITASNSEKKCTVTINGKTYRIRKLTPRECWRLMDYSDEDFDKAAAMGTASQHLYKQAGNGIVVACLEGIYDKLFVHTDLTESKQLTLF